MALKYYYKQWALPTTHHSVRWYLVTRVVAARHDTCATVCDSYILLNKYELDKRICPTYPAHYLRSAPPGFRHPKKLEYAHNRTISLLLTRIAKYQLTIKQTNSAIPTLTMTLDLMAPFLH